MARERSPWEGTIDRRFSGMTCIGKIVAVNPNARTCRAKTLGLPGVTDDLDLHDVRILHNAWHGEGDEETFIPRTGSYCVILFVNNEPFIIGYVPLQNASGTANPGQEYAENLQPGDKTIATIAGNRLTLRSGGAVTLESTKFCRTYWIPSLNLISSACENYELETNGGYLFWKTDDSETSEDNATRLDLMAWNSLEPTKGVRLQMGTTQPDLIPLQLEVGNLTEELRMEEIPGLKVQVTEDGTFGSVLKKRSSRIVGDAESNYSETIDFENKAYSFITPAGHRVAISDKDGEETLEIFHTKGTKYLINKDGDILLEDAHTNSLTTVKEGFTLKDSNGHQLVTTPSDITLSESGGSDSLKLTAGSATLTSGTVTVSADSVSISAGSVTLGKGGDDHAVLYSKLKTLFDLHTHFVIPIIAGESFPPTPPNTVALMELSPATSLKAEKIKLTGNLLP